MQIQFKESLEGHILIVNKEELSNRCFICGMELDTPFLLCEGFKMGLHMDCENRSRCRGDMKNDHKHIKIVEVQKR